MYQPNLRKLLLSLFIACISLSSVFAQVTTASLSGVVKTEAGEALPGATVQVTWSDAGINKGLITKSDGSFLVPNLRVGGPYTVVVSFTGYATKTATGVFLNLGQTTSLDLRLSEAAGTLSEVVVSGRSTIFNDQRTGASTNISSTQIRQLPTISRSADDYLRLTPSASPTYNGISFAGRTFRWMGRYLTTHLAWMRLPPADRQMPNPSPSMPLIRFKSTSHLTM